MATKIEWTDTAFPPETDGHILLMNDGNTHPYSVFDYKVGINIYELADKWAMIKES